MRILLVEDDSDTRFLYMRALRIHGHEVIAAFNATSAVYLLGTETFDLVLLDIILDAERSAPTGWAVAAFMQSDPKLRKIPIIVISALEADAVRAGAKTYTNILINAVMIFGKPLNADDLVLAVERVVEGKANHEPG